MNSVTRIPKPHITGGPQGYTVPKLPYLFSLTENIKYSIAGGGFNIIHFSVSNYILLVLKHKSGREVSDFHASIVGSNKVAYVLKRRLSPVATSCTVQSDEEVITLKRRTGYIP
jgi:hypothetical protein